MKVKKKVVFYNKGHIGDLHLTRQYVKMFPKWFPSCQFSYLHAHHPAILADTELPMYNAPELLAQLPHDAPGLMDNNNTLYLNTWVYAAGNISFCTFQSGQSLMLRYFHMLLDSVRDSSLTMDSFVTIPPSIDYDKAYVDVDAISSYFEERPEPSIYICNNYTANNQSYNDNMNFFIERLSREVKMPIYLSNKIAPLIDNPLVKYAEDLIGNHPKPTLNSLSYFSTFCSVIIGRGSGPFTFSEVKENLNKLWFSMTFPHVGCDVFNGLHLYSKNGEFRHTQDEDLIVETLQKAF